MPSQRPIRVTRRTCTLSPLAEAAATMGMTAWVTPPPRLPQPAVVAFAIPTQFGANITEVWYWVMTNEAPITPMHKREKR